MKYERKANSSIVTAQEDSFLPHNINDIIVATFPSHKYTLHTDGVLCVCFVIAKDRRRLGWIQYREYFRIFCPTCIR